MPLLYQKKKNTSHYIAYILSILWPFFMLLKTMKDWRSPWAKNAFWIVCTFMGIVQIYQLEGTILGTGADGGRYVMDLIDMHNNVSTFADFAQMFNVTGFVDVYCKTITYITSRFTENGHVLFFVFALIYGYFYSRNLWYVVERLPKKVNPGVFVLFVFFMLICPIWNINGVRMWTALHVFVFGALPYLIEGKKNRLIWCFLSIMVHHSFLLPIAVISIYALTRKFLTRSSAVLTTIMVLYIFSLTINQLNIEALNQMMQNYLPDFYSDRIDVYVTETEMENRAFSAAGLSSHVYFFKNLQFWIVQIFIFISFICINKYRSRSHILLNLFTFALIFYAIANIASNVPSGGRFALVAQMFMVPVFMFVLAILPIPAKIKLFGPIVLFLLAFSMLFNIRAGLDFYGIMLVVGNFFSAPFIVSDVPIIDYIKDFIL